MPNNDNLVIVLDPGHGGENEGLKHRGLLEKDMNLVTANAMRDELLQYDNVEVYITNPEKKDMSLKERAQYAKDVGADILISLHFNMSETHEMYGSEVWIPSKGLGYSKMRSLGDIFMEQFDELGFTLRGVKARLNDDGLDYYGILRESAALGVKSILVEHGYADHEMDFEKVNDEADWQLLGRSDATAVAKYFRLKSSSLGRDYSSYIKNGYHAPEEAVGSDLTEPESAVLIYQGASEAGELFQISGWDSGSRIVYYDYSTDGGKSWSDVLPFENGAVTADICISDMQPGSEVCARVYNGHFLYTQTNSVFYKDQDMAAQENSSAQEVAAGTSEGQEQAVMSDAQTAMALTTQENVSIEPQSRTGTYFSLFGVVAAILLLVTAWATYKERMKRRRMGREQRKAGFMPLRRMQQIENICLLTGICILLVSVTMFGVSFAKSRAAQQNVKESMASVQGQELSGDGTPEQNMQSGVQEVTETVYVPEIDIERTEGYVVSSNGVICAGEELLLQAQQNQQAAIPKETVVVYDIAEGYLRVPLIEGIERNRYDLNGFSGTDLEKTYTAGDGVKVMRGIDVSKFQGTVDWQQVKDAGVEFVILRLGIRGYGTGELKMDERFRENYAGAVAAGLKVGVYFFSAAINEEEGLEEADFVLRALQDCIVEMPVVFDTELILDDEARTHDLTPDQITSITKAFCDRIRDNGYEPMIYSNAKRFSTVLHLEELEEYDKWLADYRQSPDYPYAFRMWQFTEKGTVPGILGNVDINLYFYKE